MSRPQLSFRVADALQGSICPPSLAYAEQQLSSPSENEAAVDY
ncbi:hypothetical protein [Stieleria mannarensis]|nr:hypothetical protein [Rhodopirellula sp. JC639]